MQEAVEAELLTLMGCTDMNKDENLGKGIFVQHFWIWEYSKHIA